MTTYEKYWVHAVVAVVALIVGFAGGAYWRSQSDMTAGTVPSNLSTSTESEIDAMTAGSSTSTNGSVGGKTYSIYVPAQKAGSNVVVESLTVKEGSWIVITEDENGAPGRILGAHKFFPGTITGTVGLLRATVAGSKYHAIIYNDNGDNEFDYKVDGPITNNDAKAIESIFIVS